MAVKRHPRVSASILEGYEAFASRKGLDYDRLLASSGLTRADLSDPGKVISLNAAARFMTLAAEQAGDPCLGVQWAEAYTPGGTGVLGYLIMNAASVRQAMKAITRYIHLVLSPVEVKYEEADGFGHLLFRLPPEFDAPRVQYVSFAMALLISRLRRHAGRDWTPVGVDLEHRELPCRETVLRAFGPNVRFDRIVNSLHIRKAILERGSIDADTRLFDLIRQLGDRMLSEQQAAADIVHSTRKAIARQLDRGTVRVRDVAENLGMATTTLQSRLATAGTTYEQVLASTRRSLADLYLRDTELALTEIAFLLGFSELSAFTRAAQRWYGAPPSQRRSELRKT